jgi:hypothetical protein
MGIRITGLENLRRRVRELQERAQDVAEPHQVPLDELLTSEFMVLNTDFESADSMLRASGLTIRTTDDLEGVPAEAWDSFIASHTRFGTWKDLLAAAGAAYVQRRLQLD